MVRRVEQVNNSLRFYFPHSVQGQLIHILGEISSVNISKTLLRRITKFHSDIHTDIVYSRTGYDVIIYFWSEVIVKKAVKIPPLTASGGSSQERFKLGPRNVLSLSRTTGIIHVPETTSLTVSVGCKMLLNTA